MSKRLISIFLVLCLILPMLGMFGWLQQRRKEVRREVKHQIIAGLERSELVLLTFTPEQHSKLKWKHSKEFEFEGEMFDIVETEVVDGVTQYWCWSDDEETALNKQLFELTNIALGLDPLQQKNKDNFQQYCKTLFYETPCDWRLNEGLILAELPQHNCTIASWKISPPLPPPELS
ncbi:MAG: hypothetical protein H6603_02180 [Flavobacteriales bacterium]|nr:hypothetical protein [Flavobacteriales bacterium]MCB9192298.1 hypothetical protein [Flavobacteriales bacterium]MCB9203760.1 hypothetical protein [Flavobacteriales bacterium]